MAIVILGQEVFDKLQADKVAKIEQVQAGIFKSEPLCKWQIETFSRGFRGAAVVKTIFGYSLRHDTGLANWSIIFGVRTGTTTGKVADLLEKAKQWVAEDPAKRYVTCSDVDFLEAMNFVE